MIATVTSVGTHEANIQIKNKTINLNKTDIPFELKPGDVLIIQGDINLFKIMKKAVNASVDSIEDGIAHLEISTGEIFDIPISDTSFRISEGDILLLEKTNEGYKIIGKNREEKEKRLERIRQLREAIRKKQESKSH